MAAGDHVSALVQVPWGYQRDHLPPETELLSCAVPCAYRLVRVLKASAPKTKDVRISKVRISSVAGCREQRQRNAHLHHGPLTSRPVTGQGLSLVGCWPTPKR